MEFTVNTNPDVDVRYKRHPDGTVTALAVEIFVAGKPIDIASLLDEGLVEDLEDLIAEELYTTNSALI